MKEKLLSECRAFSSPDRCMPVIKKYPTPSYCSKVVSPL